LYTDPPRTPQKNSAMSATQSAASLHIPRLGAAPRTVVLPDMNETKLPLRKTNAIASTKPATSRSTHATGPASDALTM